MTHSTGSHRCTGLSGTIYILTFENGGWFEPLTEIKRVRIDDKDATVSVLGVYQTRELAESVGDELVSQRLQSRVDGYDSLWESPKQGWDPQDDWDSGETSTGGCWSRSVSEYQSESVGVVVEERMVLSDVPGHEGEGEEGEDSDEEESKEKKERKDEKKQRKECLERPECRK